MSLLAVLLVLMGIVSLQLLRVQVLGADRYVQLGEDQRLRGVELTAGRGIIFDRNENQLATTEPRRTIVADPRAVAQPEMTARELARLMKTEAAPLYERLSEEAAFVYLGRQVENEVADAVEAQQLDGIWTIEEPLRLNPSDDLARSLLGTVDTDNVGTSGLELAFEEQLTGTDGWMVLERDPQGRTIPAGRRDVRPPEPGQDLILTLDRNLQFQAEQVLSEHVRRTQARGGTAIISDPRTGEIFALVNIDVDEETGQPVSSTKNTALVDTYEPGSVAKVIPMAGALERDLITSETTLSIPPSVNRGGHTFNEDRCTAAREYSISEILARSCNVGTILVAEQLGEEALYDYLLDFGFGEPSGLAFPNEATGLFPEPRDWSGAHLATIPLGQGIAVTPMQMLFAYNTIANGGLYQPPMLVGSKVDADGNRQDVPAGESRRVISSATAAEVRTMMTSVVSPDGTGDLAAIEGYEVAGKTGTARKPNPEGGGYTWPDGYRYTATFAGFMPADDPTLSVLVVLDEPQGTNAGVTAAPAFRELARYALRSLKLAPATA